MKIIELIFTFLLLIILSGCTTKPIKDHNSVSAGDSEQLTEDQKMAQAALREYLAGRAVAVELKEVIEEELNDELKTDENKLSMVSIEKKDNNHSIIIFFNSPETVSQSETTIYNEDGHRLKRVYNFEHCFPPTTPTDFCSEMNITEDYDSKSGKRLKQTGHYVQLDPMTQEERNRFSLGSKKFNKELKEHLDGRVIKPILPAKLDKKFLTPSYYNEEMEE